MLSRLRKIFYWPGHSDEVQLRRSNCPECVASALRRRAPLQSMTSGYAMLIAAMDIIGQKLTVVICVLVAAN